MHMVRIHMKKGSNVNLHSKSVSEVNMKKLVKIRVEYAQLNRIAYSIKVPREKVVMTKLSDQKIDRVDGGRLIPI